MGRFEAPGVEPLDALWHRELGTAGAPPLVMLHGFLGTHATWLSLAGALRRSWRVVLPDLYGHGQSGIPRDRAHLTPDGTARDVLALAAAVAPGPLALVGYSLGGRVALRMAAAAPERVAALVLVSASPGIAAEDERSARRAADARLADQIEAGGLSAFMERWDENPVLASGRPLSEAQHRRLAHDRRRQRAAGLAASLRWAGGGQQPDTWPLLPHWPIPTLVVAGAVDVKYAALARRAAGLIPDAELAVLEGVGHRVPLEAPAELSRLVSRFLTAARDRAPARLRRSAD